MKTLDEVITALEDEGVFPDALYHLKEYRSDKLQYDADRREWYETWQEKLKKLEESRQRFIDKLKELEIGTLNDPLTWSELFAVEMIGRPVWSEEKHAWFLIADSALDNRSWVDLVDSSGKITRLGPHDLEKYQLYKREKK